MTNDKNQKGKDDDNIIKKTSQEANKFFDHTVDTSGKIIKSISGEGGLVGKATDASGNILKGAAGKANDIIEKTSEAPGNLYKSVKGRKNQRGEERKDHKDE
ncbi:hypothetical protein [Oceanobacillus timonensis]|uniref:hypothetical protein n=1 Tax=Oceanobacillus timonensis TaxID=1926285 RepID=UPI001FE5F9FD|nr:hypothetical protein [Oceanobacillus timonensis]